MPHPVGLSFATISSCRSREASAEEFARLWLVENILALRYSHTPLSGDQSADVFVDLDWLPDGDPTGTYRLSLLQADWEDVFEQFESPDWVEIKHRLERWLQLVPQAPDRSALRQAFATSELPGGTQLELAVPAGWTVLENRCAASARVEEAAACIVAIRHSRRCAEKLFGDQDHTIELTSPRPGQSSWQVVLRRGGNELATAVAADLVGARATLERWAEQVNRARDQDQLLRWATKG